MIALVLVDNNILLPFLRQSVRLTHAETQHFLLLYVMERFIIAVFILVCSGSCCCYSDVSNVTHLRLTFPRPLVSFRSDPVPLSLSSVKADFPPVFVLSTNDLQDLISAVHLLCTREVCVIRHRRERNVCEIERSEFDLWPLWPLTNFRSISARLWVDHHLEDTPSV